VQTGLALTFQMATNQRRTAGEGDANIQIVGVFERACAKHAVGVNHRVGFGPDDLLARLGRAVEQVRRAGEAQLRAHGHIRIAQRTGRHAERRVYAQFTPAPLVYGNRIKSGGHSYLGAPFNQLLGKAQARRPGINAAVDMGLGNVNQLPGTLQLRHAQHDLHRDLGRLSVTTVEQCPIVLGQLNRGSGICSGYIAERF